MEQFCSTPTNLLPGTERFAMIRANDTMYMKYKTVEPTKREVPREATDVRGFVDPNEATEEAVRSTDPHRPEREDSLFWCFYILMYGNAKYEFESSGAFKIEKDMKFAIIDLVRASRDTFKVAKLVISDIEDSLANKKRIVPTTLFVMALLYGKNVWFESQRTFTRMLGGGGDEPAAVIRAVAGTTGKYELITADCCNVDEYTANLVETKYEIINIQKPVANFAAYKVEALREIAGLLGVPIETDEGKNITKRLLYDAIICAVR